LLLRSILYFMSDTVRDYQTTPHQTVVVPNMEMGVGRDLPKKYKERIAEDFKKNPGANPDGKPKIPNLDERACS
jgi:hypothetical protein